MTLFNSSGSRQPVSPDPGMGGVNPDEVNPQADQNTALNEHSTPGQAGEPGGGNYSAPSSPAMKENPVNLEVSPDQLRDNRFKQKQEDIDSISK